MKNFNFFEKLWEHSRTLRRVGLVLVMCLIAIPQMWADQSVGSVYAKFDFNGEEKNYEYWASDNKDNPVWNLGDLTSGNFKFKEVYWKCSSNWSPLCNAKGYYKINGGSDEFLAEYVDYNGYNGSYEIQNTNVNNVIATANTGNSGAYECNHWFYVNFKNTGDGWNTTVWISNNSKNYTFKYNILPPNATAITATATAGAISGSGTELDPYIVPYGGNLTIGLSGSAKERNDDNSEVQYSVDGGSSYGTTSSYTSYTISNITATSLQNYVFKARCYNSTASLESPTKTTKTVYYKAANAVPLYKFVVNTGVGNGNVCATDNTDYPQTVANGKLSTLIGGTLTARGNGSESNLKYNNNSFNFNGGSNFYLKVVTDSPLKTGDIIRYINSNSGSVAIRLTQNSSTKEIVLAGNSKSTIQFATVTSDFNGQTTFYIDRKSNTSYLEYFEILRSPYTITLNATTNGGTVSPTAMYFAASDPLLLPRATKSSNRFKGWYTGASNDVKVSDYYTATGTTTLYAQFDECTSSGTVYKFQVKTGLANNTKTEGDLNVGNFLSTLDGGTAVMTGTHAQIVNNNAISFANNGDYITVDLDCALQTGDTIITTISGSKSGIKITSTSSTTSLQNISYGTKVKTIVPSGLNNYKTFRLYEQDTNCGGLSYFEIKRPAKYTVSYNNGGGSGTMTSHSVVKGADQALTANTFTKNGYTFSCWHANVAVKVGGSTISAGGDISDGATLQAISSDVTLTAQWTCITPTFGTNLSTTQVDYAKDDTPDDLEVAATANSGTVTYQWYSNDENNTTTPTELDGETEATYTPSTAAAGTTYYYCVATNTTDECSVSTTSNIAKIVVTDCTDVGISGQPSSVAKANVGSASTLTVTASGTNPTYQWYTCNSDGSSASAITSGTNPSGYQSATLSYSPSAVGTTYYKCIVSGDCGDPVTSNVVSITAKNAISPTLTYASTVTYGSTISPSKTGTWGDGDITYTLNSVTPPSSLTIVSGTGVVAGAAAGGTATVTATIADGTNYWGGSATSETITVTTAALPGTASTGTATSVTHNSASLPFTITDVTGVASITIKVYAGESLAKTYSGITPATSGSYSATGLSASTTYTYTVTLIGDANHNDKAETAKSAAFTTSAAPTLTAISANTLYQVADMATITLTSTETAWDAGLSSNNLFKTYGSSGNTAKGNTITPAATVSDQEFTSKAYIMEADNTSSSSDPTKGAIEFITPSKAGKLLVYTVDGSDSKLSIKKKGASSSTTTNATRKTVDVDANTHYFINGAGSKRGLYGIYYDKAPEFVSSSPADEATDVSVSGTIVLTFDESIASVDATKFTLTGATRGAVAIDGEDDTKVNVAYSGAAGEATVTLSVAAEAVTDAVGNKNAALSDISFTTENTGYTITFAANGSDGGSAMTNVTDIVSGSDVALAANTWTKTEHYFDGWKTNVALTYVPNGGGDPVNVAVDGIVPNEATIKNVTSNITLTAQWHANVYNVYFFAGEGGRAIDGYTTYEYGEQKAMPTNVIRTGYVFEAWYDNSEYTGDPLTQMPADATGNKYYYAKWHELSSKCLYITGDVITAYNAVAADPGYYMYNDAKYVFGSGYDASESTLVLEAADGRSYVYLDQNIGEVKQVEVHISDIADSNVEGKGISWGFVNDDDDVATVDLTDMDQITSHAFTFRPTGDDSQYFVFKSLATTLSIDNICVFYEPQTYTVTYDKGEGATGTVPATATYNYNDVVTVEAGTALAKDGYIFRGWFDGTTFYVIGDKFKVTDDVELEAVWQSNSGCEGRSVGSLFKMQVKTGLTNGTLANDDGNFCTLTTSNYLSTLKGGTAKAQNKNEHTAITGTNAIALTDNDSYIEFSLPSAIQAGDLIIYSGASGVQIANVSEKPKTAQMLIAAGTNVTVMVGAESDLVGYSKIYMYSQSSSSTVTYFEVRRPVFYMSVGTPDAYSFPSGETAITTSNGLDVLVGGSAKAGCSSAGQMQLRGSSNYDLMFYTYSGGYLKLDLDNALAQGDIISFTVGSGSNQLAITKTGTWSDAIATSAKTYTIPAESPLIGAETIYLWGKSGTSYAKTISIIRAADAVSGGGEVICHFTVSFACKTGFEALDDRLPADTEGVPDGAHIGAPEDPFAIGFAFLGWYDDAACSDGHEVNFETLTITENTTIYAKWENNVKTFTGDAGTTAWETAGNWDAAGMPISAYPYCYSQVYIKAPAEIAKDTKAHVGRLDIVNDRSSNTGQLTIASGAMLIVYDKVSRITNWLTQERLATIADDIYIGSERDDDAYSWREQGALNGALIMGDYDHETQADSATIQFATQSYTKSGDGSWGEREVNQYIGIPFTQANVSDYKPYEKYKYAQVYLMEHDRPNCSWLQMSEDQDMYEFVGYDIICYSFAPDAYTSPKPIFDLKGELASTDEERSIHLREYRGYYGAEYNENILANSWTAPIDIASFEVSDFENAEATIYMFNAGTQAEYDGNMEWASNYSTYPGQYTAIPINDLKLHPYYYVGYKTIPSMQSFSVITLDNDGNSLTYHDLSYLTMDYKRLVYDPAVEAVGVTTETMHAPRRVPTMEEEPLAIMLHVHGMSGMGDRIRILEREDFSYGRDNGWETSKLLGIIEAPSLYAVTEVGDQATVAVPDVEGLGLTFQAGEYDNVYTFNFEYEESDEPLYLLDKKTGIYTRVLTENTYSFVTTDKNFNERFLLTRNYQMPEVATGLENAAVDSSLNERVQKVLINDMIYILRDGHIYDATGKMLK